MKLLPGASPPLRFAALTASVALLAAGLPALAPPFAASTRGIRASSGQKPADAAREAKADSDKPWKIDELHGPSKTVSFTTDEGTWISLDVSPDGRQVVFSLLGDLYILPISGGEAKRITSGPAYDIQPRFSPDGKWIAFASDRGGTENLWICDPEGKNARQISKEKETDVNSPAWSPDGDYLVGRRHFTDVSSIGTRELWMWHIKGGQGIQITKKDDQPEAADPSFSPDGRFIYFSARDGRYRYDSNVYSGIWQIKRFDRKTGQVVPLTGEFGGAAAPTPSPDGQSLAYVRRIRAKTVLEVMELNTGKIRTLAEGLERDEQQGFASHGVFPGFAWTPDSRSILATADGKIWRWDASTGSRAGVPFNASVEQRVTDALRFPHQLGGDTVRARIIRWPVESPDGKRLVFSAVGHLYVMDLPSGTPTRLTRLEDLEYCPAFSPDGKLLAFVTWNDRNGGDVWVMSGEPSGSKEPTPPRKLTQYPGQYANPSFSADGKKVVYLKGSGATFRDEDLGRELWHEIHWVSIEGGPSHYVIGTKNRGENRRMTRPAFSRDGERIFFVEDEPAEKQHEPPKTLLVSVKLDGTDRKAHLRFAKAEEAAVSPDGRWVAFNELHNAYVTALPQVGTQTVEVSLEKSGLPLGQLTDEGGEWVGWADGGRTLTWIFGPVYHRLAFDKALPPPEPEEEKAATEGKAGGKGADADEEKNEKEKKKKKWKKFL